MKKSLFGYVNMGLGTILTSVYLYTLFVSLFEMFELNHSLDLYVGYIPLKFIVSSCLMVISVGLFFLISFYKSKIIKNEKPSIAKANKVFYAVSMTVAFIALGVVIFFSLYVNGSLQYITGTELFREHLAYASGESIFFSNKLFFLYACVLKFAFRVFGIYGIVPVIVNLVFVVASIIFIVFSVKIIFGRVASFAVLLGAIFLIDYGNILFDLSGDSLWLIIVSFLLFTLTYFGEILFNKVPVTAICIYVAFFLLMVALNDLLFKPFMFVFDFETVLRSTVLSQNYLVPVSFFVLLALWGFLSYSSAKKDEISLCNILLLGFFALNLFDFSSNRIYLVPVVIISILAGKGVEWFLFGGFKACSSEECLNEVKLDKMEENKEDIKEEIRVDKEAKEVEAKEAVQAEKETKMPDIPVVKPSVEPIKTPTFLHNPLPVPKKHVSKTMDFSVEPSADKMKFDIDVSENDDFDVN